MFVAENNTASHAVYTYGGLGVVAYREVTDNGACSDSERAGNAENRVFVIAHNGEILTCCAEVARSGHRFFYDDNTVSVESGRRLCERLVGLFVVALCVVLGLVASAVVYVHRIFRYNIGVKREGEYLCVLGKGGVFILCESGREHISLGGCVGRRVFEKRFAFAGE